MIKDRGMIKWTSLMLPEHVNRLKELWEEDEQLHLPILDEQQLAEMNDLLYQAYEQQLTVRVTWHDTLKKHFSLGKITSVHLDEQTIDLQTTDREQKIPTINILNISRPLD